MEIRSGEQLEIRAKRLNFVWNRLNRLIRYKTVLLDSTKTMHAF